MRVHQHGSKNLFVWNTGTHGLGIIVTMHSNDFTGFALGGVLLGVGTAMVCAVGAQISWPRPSSMDVAILLKNVLRLKIGSIDPQNIY